MLNSWKNSFFFPILAFIYSKSTDSEIHLFYITFQVRSKSGTQTPLNSNPNFNFCNFRTKSASDQTTLTHTTYCAQNSRLQQNTSNTAESVNTKRYSHSSSPLKQSNVAHSQNISDLPNNFPVRLITNAYGNLSQHSAQGKLSIEIVFLEVFFWGAVHKICT